MEESSANSKVTIKSNEIDLLELLKKIIKNKKVIYKTMLWFIFLGIILILITPKEYKTNVKLLPEIQQGKSGAAGLLKQFGGLAGINLMDDNTDAIRPDLFPEIIKSTPFLLHLLNLNITSPNINRTTLNNYLKNQNSILGIILKYTIGLPSLLKSSFSKDNAAYQNENINQQGVLILSKETEKSILDLSKRITANVDDKLGIITISVEMPDALLSAQIADSAVHFLREYITEYRVSKAQNVLNYVSTLQKEAKLKLIEAQSNLSNFRDANKNVISSRRESEGQNLQNEYNMAFSVYSGLSERLEQAKIKVNEETPIFKVMEPAKVEYLGGPSKLMLLIVILISGFFFGIVVIIVREKVKHLYNMFKMIK